MRNMKVMERSRKSEKTLVSCMDELRQTLGHLEPWRCVQGMSVTTQDYEDYNNYAHIHVFMLCFVLMFLWILVFTLSLVLDVNMISPRIRNSKNKVLFFWDVVVRLRPVIVHSIGIPNSCIFHIAKTGFVRFCLCTKISDKNESDFVFLEHYDEK